MVSQIVITPQWFYGAATVLEAFAIIVAFFIAVLGYKAYKLTKEKQHLYFGAAFGLITLSFLARAATILYLSTESTAIIRELLTTNVFQLGRFFYVMLVLIAYLIILLIYTKLEHKKLIAVLLTAILAATFAIRNTTTTFFVISIVLLSFITAQLYDNYRIKQKKATFFIFIAFLLQVFQYLSFLGGSYYDGFYVGAYLLQFISYLILFITLLKVQLHGRTKNAA